MSDSSSEDEDLSRFRDAVDTSFTKLINEARGDTKASAKDDQKAKSERHLEESGHYNDVKVPEDMQRKIGAKMSAIINSNIEFVDIQQNVVKTKKNKIECGVKLFSTSEDYLSCEVAKDTYTVGHNAASKRIGNKRRQIECDDMCDQDKIIATAVSGEYVLSKEEIKFWKSRRKEKLFRYKSTGKSKVLKAVE